MEAKLWTCPHCNRGATIGPQDTIEGESLLTIKNVDGPWSFKWNFIVCPNPECRKFTLTANLYKLKILKFFGKYMEPSETQSLELLNTWNLIPPSKAKVFPSYIPKVIIEDYNEACLIADLSPKASATLSRRCLQGILRDFWKVTPANLDKEMNQIKDKVESSVWDAIDSVRTVGNIGAHMENDINIIVDVEPNEAALLIELIEYLIEKGYVAREAENARLAKIKKLGKAKKKARKQGKPKTESNTTQV